jgi:hypothetical protein
MAINTTYKVTKGTPESLLSLNRINDQDLPLVQRLELDTVFKPSQNRLDVFFYSLDGRYLSSKIDSRTYSVVQGGSRSAGQIEDITLNPEKDSIDAGYPNGDVNVLYNFVNNLLAVNNTQPKLFIESISPDRTEIRALTNDVSRKNIVRFIDTIKSRLNDNSYFEDFRLNFGRNQLLIGINIDRVEYNNSQAILIKLYEPLPASINVKDTFLLEELVGDSVLYQVITEVSQVTEQTRVPLRGPNYDVELIEENNNPTGYLSYDELFSYPVTNSYYEIYSLFNEKSAQISIDHTNFDDFIQFSSAEERIRNFYYKASLLESYREQIDARSTFTASLVENIQGIVNNFDHYDRYLYYETGSWSWPKSTATRPFQLHSTGSNEVQSWYSTILLSASNYDASNQDRLINSIPSFIRDDSNNAPYLLFADMIGQHFDNLWIYSKAVTDKFNADNRLEFGISKDLVRDAIENFGIKLYNNNEALENLFSAIVGESYNTGSEQISSIIVAVEGSGSLSGSVGNEHLQPMPKSSYQKEVYKRIYHNIPLLLKSKGTERGLRALINTFGIPSDILKIKTFGGADTSTTPFYGPNSEVTSSLGKIRVSNTDSIVTGSTLSNYTTVVNLGKDYSTDLHTIEVGFSPADNLDAFIKSHPSMSAFDIDSYLGDPGYAYSGSYSGLNTLAETVFTSGSSFTNVYDVFDFVRLIKFFDNSIFRIIKDFVPARSNISTGVIIKPHLLNRSKVKQPQVKWANQTSPKFVHAVTQLDYTGSYYTTNFSIEGEIDTAFITGSAGLNSGYTSSYTEIYANPSGGFQTLIRNNHDEPSYTGEFSGSIVRASTGDLTAGNTFRKLEPEQFSFKYIPRNDFNSPTQVLIDATPAYYTAEVSASVDSPNQGSDTLIFNSDTTEISGTNSFTFDFKIDGGPNAGNGVADSGSLFISPSLTIKPSETVIVELTAIFTDLDRLNIFNTDSNDKAKLIIELVAGNTVRDSITLTRSTLNSFTQTAKIKFENNTVTEFFQDAGDFTSAGGHHFRIKYSSNYETPDPVSDLTDVQVLASFRKFYFNSDAITLWLSEESLTDFTRSTTQAMSVPLNSPTNGYMVPYLENASEVVFEYPGFNVTDYYSATEITSSVLGGSYRANITVSEDDILLTHSTSAPYSASFTQTLPDLNNGDNIEFKFLVDFNSYWSTYLSTNSGANTPFVTASIRNSSTGTVIGNLSSKFKQGEYPVEYNQTLLYENTTGGTLSNLEFYYQVNVPKADKGSGNPEVNLKNIKINYRTDTVVFNRSKIEFSKRLPDIYYLDINPDVEVSSGSLGYFEPSSEYYKIGFIPGESQNLSTLRYDVVADNVDSVRRSSTKLVVDEKTYTPTQGSYKGFFLPENYAIISSSIVNGVQTLDERFFAEVQDSNYYSIGWRNGRYDGSETSNLVGGFRVLGKEPALTYESFSGSLFSDASTTTEIKTKFSGSELKEGDVEVYYNSFTPGDEQSITLTGVNSTETNCNLVTRNATTYELEITTPSAVATGVYSGSLGNLSKNDTISTNLDITLTAISSGELDVASIVAEILEPGVTVPVGQLSYNGADFSNGLNNLQLTFDSLSRNVNNAIFRFTFSGFTDGGGGSGELSLLINSLNIVSLLPLGSSQGTIVKNTSTGRTVFYEKTAPTPSSPNGYNPLIKSKIYRFDNDTVYTTNDKGIVTNIE